MALPDSDLGTTRRSTRVGFWRSIGRALRLRCPRCEGGRLFRRWLAMADDCPTCGLHFERVDGYWLGSMALNLIVTEGLFLLTFISWTVAAWPDPPWTAILVVSIALNIVVPLVFHPFSRTLWTAGERHFYVRSHPNEDA